MTTLDEARELSKGAAVQPVQDMVPKAIAHAERHLSEINRHRMDVQVDGYGFRNHPEYVYNSVTLHSRAFLWELVAAFDLTLCWMNERFSLGLDDHQVTWSRIEAKCKKTSDPQCAAAFAEVNSAHSSEWFSAVTRYRNYAHRNFIFTEGSLSKDGDPQIVWPRAVECTPYVEDLSDALTRYLAEFKGYVARLTPLMA
ncbi:hypothetical protein [Achromobacter spanius]|uniref:hypothetical protein n=1 Tax=Achromobacter spanius TaxID=217203 RepID=UPI003208B177